MLDRNDWRAFIAVTASVAVLGLGVGSTLPLTALVLTGRGYGPQAVGWLAAATSVGGLIGTLLTPAATQRFGRRLVMLTCVTTAAYSVIVLQWVESPLLWAWLRAAFGGAMAPLFVIGEAWICSLPGNAVRGRAVAIYTTSFTICQLAGPLLTAAALRLPAHAFEICGAAFLLAIPGIALARDERREERQPGTSADGRDAWASWVEILRAAPTVIAGAAVFAAFDSIILTFLPLFGLDHGVDRGGALIAIVAVFLGDATLQFAAGSLADRFGHARVSRVSAAVLCVLLPLLPVMWRVPWAWLGYLYVMGGVAGSLYTLAIVSSGERFSGAALLRASGLIALTWNVASSVGPAATGIVIEHLGSSSMTAVLWLMALGFLAAERAERSHRAHRAGQA